MNINEKEGERERKVIEGKGGGERERRKGNREGNGGRERERWGRREGGREKYAGIIENQKPSSSKLRLLTSD